MKSRSTIWLIAAITALVTFVGGLSAQQVFRNTITGESLDLNEAPEEGRDTKAVKEFLNTATNLYIEGSTS